MARPAPDPPSEGGLFTPDCDVQSVKVRAHVMFEGLVQGVFFRANTRECALRHGLTGWIRNRPDGSVEAIFEGEEAVVKAAIEWCATEQPHARVDRRTVEFSEAVGEFDTFSVAH